MAIKLFGGNVLSLPQQVQKNTELIEQIFQILSLPKVIHDEWQDDVQYNVNDIVFYAVDTQKNIFMCIKENYNTPPSLDCSIYWLLVAINQST